MDDEERTRNGSSCSSSACLRNSGLGRNLKKAKPKKIPQRGLGVAQLEKIRLEEEVKNDVGSFPSSAMPSLSGADSYNQAHFGHAPCSGHIIPFGSLSRLYPFAHDSPFGRAPCNRHLSVRQRSAGSFSTQANNASPDSGHQSKMFAAEAHGNNSVSSEYTLEMEKSSMPPPYSVHPSYEPNFMVHFRGTMQHDNHHQPTSLNSSPMVNGRPASSSSPVLYFRSEPPSNQSLCGNYGFEQPDDAQRTVDGKRSCPFRLRDVSNPSLHGKFNPFVGHANSHAGAATCGNAHSFVTNGNVNLRDNPPGSLSSNDLHQTNEMNGDIIKLPLLPSQKSLPATMSLLSNPKHKQGASASHPFSAGILESAPLPSKMQTPIRNSIIQHESRLSIHAQRRRPYYNFLPAPNNLQQGQETASSNDRISEPKYNVDLNLKL